MTPTHARRSATAGGISLALHTTPTGAPTAGKSAPSARHAASRSVCTATNITASATRSSVRRVLRRTNQPKARNNDDPHHHRSREAVRRVAAHGAALGNARRRAAQAESPARQDCVLRGGTRKLAGPTRLAEQQEGGSNKTLIDQVNRQEKKPC